MSFTRDFLKAMGLTEEQVSAIMAAHVEVTTGLKAERDQYKASAELLPKVQGDLAETKKQLEAASKNEYEALYKSEHEAFEKFKTETTAKESKRVRQDIGRGLLREAGIPEKRVEAVLRLMNLDELELNEKSELTDRKKTLQAVKTEYADYTTTPGQLKDEPDNPPGNVGTNAFKSMSLADKMAYADQHPGDAQVVEWLKNPAPAASGSDGNN